MVIGRQSFAHPSLLHDEKAHRVGERPRFVLALLQKLPPGRIQRRGYVYQLNVKRLPNRAHKSQHLRSGQRRSTAQQRNQFSEDIVGCDDALVTPLHPLGLNGLGGAVLGLAPVGQGQPS